MLFDLRAVRKSMIKMRLWPLRSGSLYPLPSYASLLSPSQRRPLPKVLIHNLGHTSPIMLRLAHVVQPCPPRPLQSFLRYLHTLHQGTKDLDVHLNSDSC